MREHWVQERTALINRIRALLSKLGLVFPTGRTVVQREVPLIFEAADNALPDIARAVLADYFDHLQTLNQRIDDTEQCFEMVSKASPNTQRILKVLGIWTKLLLPSSLPSAKANNSIPAETLPPGSDWYRDSIQQVVNLGLDE